MVVSFLKKLLPLKLKIMKVFFAELFFKKATRQRHPVYCRITSKGRSNPTYALRLLMAN